LRKIIISKGSRERSSLFIFSSNFFCAMTTNKIAFKLKRNDEENENGEGGRRVTESMI
jgi:hypothetical protein